MLPLSLANLPPPLLEEVGAGLMKSSLELAGSVGCGDRRLLTLSSLSVGDGETCREINYESCGSEGPTVPGLGGGGR